MTDIAATPMRPLHPPVEPHASGMLDVGDGHRLRYEVSGNPAGQPVLFLHGGPGSGCKPEHRRFFEPRHWRIVLFEYSVAPRFSSAGYATSNG